MTSFLVVFEAYRLVLRLLVATAGLHLVGATLSFWRSQRRVRHDAVPSAAAPDYLWPRVTVQLPVRDEVYVVERALRAAAALDYPAGLLEVQLIDDSSDETSSVAAHVIEELRAGGLEVRHLRREHPQGYKAGALAAGLAVATGDLVAVFDADFVPAPDFLRRVLPHFADPRVGMVQGRWEHLNRTHSWFTRLQAQLIDGLMIVEQTARSLAGQPFQFNGTAGVWRRACIDAVGGWSATSLTEDLDLSLRAQLAGWRFVHLPEVAVPGELPATLGLFRVQQRRWALGSALLLRRRWWEVLRSPLPWRSRLGLLMHLGRHGIYPLLLLMTVSVPATTFSWLVPPLDYGLANAAVAAIAVLGLWLQQGAAARFAGQSAAGALLRAPLTLALAIGLAPTFSVALAYGLSDRAGPFFRTPKGLASGSREDWSYRARRSVLIVPEILVGLGLAVLALLAVQQQLWPGAALLALMAVGYCWVGVGSLAVALPRAVTSTAAGSQAALRSEPAQRQELPARIGLAEGTALAERIGLAPRVGDVRGASVLDPITPGPTGKRR